MGKRKKVSRAIAIDRPMVLIAAEHYEELLEEAGYVATPKLDRELREARARFRIGKTVSWKKSKNELQTL